MGREVEIAQDIFNVMSSRADAFAGFAFALAKNTDDEGVVALGAAFREWMESLGTPVVVMDLVAELADVESRRVAEETAACFAE